MDSIGTHILDLAKSHQKGRVPDDGTRATFHITERWRKSREAKAWRLTRLGWTLDEIAGHLGVKSKQTISNDLSNNGHLSEFGRVLGPDWNEKVPTQAQIGERIGWSREQVRNYGFVLDKVGTRILEMAKTHQEGRVPENGTRVTFHFTEGWFRPQTPVPFCRFCQFAS